MNKVYIILQRTFSCNTQVRSVWSTKPLAQTEKKRLNDEADSKYGYYIYIEEREIDYNMEEKE
jgi:hypothetical protein